MELGPADPEIPVGSWMLDDEPGIGEGIVWRVRSADTNYNTQTRSLTMEHIISTLQDQIMFGETTWEDIAGAGASECSARAAAQYILGQQSLWTLGDFAFDDVAWPYKFNGDTLFAALQTVTASCPDACWEYDLSRIPFRIHIRKISEETTCEMRAGRNIRTIKRVIDRTGMYTRFYPIGKDDLHITGDYISKNEAIYGMVAKVETYSGAETESALRSWGWERLNRHCEPKVTVTIGGLELSEATGESLDRLTLNRKCRVPLPEFGTTITERIIRIRVAEKVRKKEEVTVTLGNEIPDLAAIVGEVEKEQASGRGGGGRGGMKDAKEDHAWFVDTDEHVGMVAEAIIGHGPDGVDWSRVAEVIVDGNGIHNRVTRAEGYMVVLEAKIDLTEENLRAEFNNVAGSLRSELEMSAESLRTEFVNLNNSTRSELQITSESMRVEFENQMSSARSEIEATAEAVRAKVSKGDVATQLAVECGNVHVSGSGGGGNLVVDGYIQTSELDATFINGLFSGAQVFSSNYGFIRNLECTSFTQGEYTMDLSDAVTNVKIESSGGNTYTLFKKHFYSSDWENAGNFSRAVASVSWSWSGGMAKAVLSPQDQTFYSKQIDAIQPHGQATWDSDSKGFTVTLDVDDTDGTTVFSDDIHFDTSASYSAGYSAVKGSYTKSGGVLSVSKAASGASFPLSFSIDAGITYDSATHKYTAKALCDDDLMDSTESGTEAYTAGVTDGEGKFTLTSVTLQGSAYGDITPIGTAHKFTYTHLYKAGTAATYYNAGSSITYYRGNGSSVTGRGDSVSVTPIGTAHKLKYTKLYKTQSATAEAQWAYVADSNGTTTWYSAGTATTYYKGNGSSVTGRGGTVTLTEQGSAVSVTKQGDTQWAYVADSSGATTYYDAGTKVTGLRRAGTVNSTDYYLKTS